MRYIKPQYYDSFRCLADKCPDTCCAGWQIVIDDASLDKYQNMKGDIGNRLAVSVDWREGSFFQNNGRCAFLNEENLCDLVIKAGDDALCETCTRYPRHIEEFADLRELSLSLSCPVAAQMILLHNETLQFIIEEDDEKDPLEEEFEDFDFLLFTQLEDARGILFQILQKRDMSMQERTSRILDMAMQLQSCVDEERLFDMETVIRKFSVGAELPENEQEMMRQNLSQTETEEMRFKRLKTGFAIFYRLEHLREAWEDILQEAWDTLYAGNYEKYQRIREDFMKEFGKNGVFYAKWESFKENLVQFFLYTYFCGAVYDDWIYSKAALAMFSVCYIEEFVMTCWYLADKKISWQKCVELAYCYAREIEHSDDNLNLLEEWLQQNR